MLFGLTIERQRLPWGRGQGACLRQKYPILLQTMSTVPDYLRLLALPAGQFRNTNWRARVTNTPDPSGSGDRVCYNIRFEPLSGLSEPRDLKLWASDVGLNLDGESYRELLLDSVEKWLRTNEQEGEIEVYGAIEEPGTGIEAEAASAEDITEPFDPTEIRVETRTLTIDLLRARIKNGELELAPDFQRKAGIWSLGAQSRLIESMLIRIPLPAFYFDATDENRWVVVDGLQRLTTIDRFVVKQSFKLEGLEFLKLDGLYYRQLPRNLQRRIDETQVTIYVIEKGTPPEVKFNIFKRINTGGLPLSAQEIRHALNQGRATKFLAELAEIPEFLKATDRSIRDDRMADRECVLRFLAFLMTDPEEYRSKDFDGFLNDRMADLNNMTESSLDSYRRCFARTLLDAWDLFDRDAFRKRYDIKDGRYPINKALFETWCVNLARLTPSEVQILKVRGMVLRAAFISLMNNRDFDRSISQGTGDRGKVRLRFSAIQSIIRKVLEA
jgi:hypothetical protein